MLRKVIYLRLGFVPSVPIENHSKISHKVYAEPVLPNEIASGNDPSSYSLSNAPHLVRIFCPLTFPFKVPSMIFLAPLLAFLSLVLQVAAHLESYGHDGYHGRHFDEYTGAKNLSAQDILDKGIKALGGRANLNALKGVTSHA